jgi:alpha-beta hydrolase superfamily lysophospholipase
MLDGEAIPLLEEEVRSGDLALHVEHFDPPAAPRRVLVMVHGFGLYAGVHRHVGAELARRGIGVTQFDLRGHGRSGGLRGHADRFEDYLADLDRIAALARQRHPGVPLALLGHSLGGLIVLSWALDAKRAGHCERLVAVAPWLELRLDVSLPKRAAARVFGRLCPTLSMHNGLAAKDISRNPVVTAGFDSDPSIHHVATAGWFAGVLQAQAHLRSMPADLRMPVLFVLAGQDRIVSTEAAQACARAVPLATTRVYPELFHAMLFEPEWRQVVADIADWLLRPLG